MAAMSVGSGSGSSEIDIGDLGAVWKDDGEEGGEGWGRSIGGGEGGGGGGKQEEEEEVNLIEVGPPYIIK
jgi:hypothetical protein